MSEDSKFWWPVGLGLVVEAVLYFFPVLGVGSSAGLRLNSIAVIAQLLITPYTFLIATLRASKIKR